MSLRGRILFVGLCASGGLLPLPVQALQQQSRGQTPQTSSESSVQPSKSNVSSDTTEKTSQSSAIFDRKVTLVLTNASAKAAVQALEKAIGIRVWFRNDLLTRIPSITIKEGTTLTVREFFDRLLQGTNLIAVSIESGELAIVEREKETQRPRASSATIGGKVTDLKSGGAIHGATITLAGTSFRAMSDSAGVFQLRNIPEGIYTLQVQTLGYAPQRLRINVTSGRDTTIAVTVDRTTAMLSEVVTTATGARQRVEVANDVTTLDVPKLLEERPVRTVVDLLEVGVPGFIVQHSSGQPGASSRSFSRGVHSGRASNDPIVIVDGVRMSFDQSDQTRYTSTLDQLDVNAIESIEVLKGPSAASLYGTDAANGVIVVKTKRGRAGPARWTFATSLSQDKMPGKYPNNYAIWGTSSYSGAPDLCLFSSPFCNIDSVSTFQWVNYPGASPFGRGSEQRYTASVTGGSNTITYALTGSQSSQTGIVKMPDLLVKRYEGQSLGRSIPERQRRPDHFGMQNGSALMSIRVNEKTDVSLTSMLTRSQRRSSGLNSAVQALVELDPISVDSLANLDIIPRAKQSNVARMFGSQNGVNASWRPTSWFSTNATFGLDVRTNDATDLLRRGDCPSSNMFCGEDSTGRLALDHVMTRTTSGNIGANISMPINALWSARLATGVQVTKTINDGFSTLASQLVVGDNSLGTAGKKDPRNSGYRTATGGVYVEGSLSAANLAYLSVGVRRDAGTSIGGQVVPTYPKWGLSLLPPNSWMQSVNPWISSLRLRAAYGHAGVQPGPADKYRTYLQTSGFVDGRWVPILNLKGIGNEQLRPERGVEFEGGPDIGLFNERIILSVTKYRRSQRDAVYTQQIALSFGADATRFENIGTVLNTGTEIAATVRAFDSPTLSWELVFNAGWTRNKLTSLNAAVANDPLYKRRLGYPINSLWTLPVLGYADIDGDGILQRSEVLIGNEEVFAGAPYPKYTAGLQSNVTLINRIHVGMTFTSQHGTTQQNTMNVGLNNPFASLPLQALSHVNSYRYQTVSILRFNTLSIGYDVPLALIKQMRMQSANISLQGTNLGMRTNYLGKDPDVNTSPTGLNLSDYGGIPQPRTWNLAIRLGL